MWRQKLSTNVLLVQLAVMLLLASATYAQRQTVRTRISESAVAELLNGRGLHVATSQVHLPANLVAKGASPELRVVSASRLSSGQMLVGVRCETPGDCLPFNATIDITGEEALSILRNGFARTVTANSIERQGFDRPGQNVSFASLERPAEVKVRLGSPVTLVIREDRMEIHLRALAMDSGSKGMRVRVRTSTPEKTFYAVVLDQSTVLGAAQ